VLAAPPQLLLDRKGTAAHQQLQLEALLQLPRHQRPQPHLLLLLTQNHQLRHLRQTVLCHLPLLLLLLLRQ
jgi:hypothetical protein